MPKRALILGIGGQDGSYLADILLEKGYEVHGLYRRSSVDNLRRIAHIRNRILLHPGDITDYSSICQALEDSDPCEVYNEADQDHVGFSQYSPIYSADVTYKGVANVLAACLAYRKARPKIFQPLSATVFGNAAPPQNEETPFNPLSPYACAKAGAYHLCRYYRQKYGMFVATAILYNHDSPRRGDGYLLQRICRQAKEGRIVIGDPNARVDIGYAKDYMEIAHGILQLDKSDDFVVGQNRHYSLPTVEQLGSYALQRAKGALMVTDSSYRPDGSCLASDCRKACSPPYLLYGPRLKDAFGVIDLILKELK